MKRHSLSALALYSIGFTLPGIAFGQTPAKTPLELLAEGKDSVRSPIPANELINRGFKFSFSGKDLIVSAQLPKACADRIEFTQVKAERLSGKIDIKTAEDLKSTAAKIVPELTFVGVPAVKTLGECLMRAEGKDPTALSLSKEALEDADEVAYLDVPKAELKSAQYLKLEKELEVATCTNCNENPEDAVHNILALKDSKLSQPLEKLAEKPIEGFVSKVVEANTEAELVSIKAALKAYSKEIDGLNISAEAKIRLKSLIYDVFTQVITRRALELGAAGPLPSQEGATPSSDMWAKYLPKTQTTTAVAGASKWVDFIAKTLEEAGEIPGINAESKKTHAAIAKQMKTKGSDVRIEMIAQMDPNHREVGEALFAANQYGAIARQQFQQMCSRGVNPYNFTQCGSLNEKIQKYQHFVQTYAPQYQAASSQDQMLWRMNQAGMNTSPTQLSMNSPFSTGAQNNGNWWMAGGQPTSMNQSMNQMINPMNTYQNQNFNQMYQNQGLLNQSSGLQVHRDLPVAIPLSGQGIQTLPMRS